MESMLELKSPKRYNSPSVVAIHPITYCMADPTTGVELQKLMNRYFLFEEKIELDKFSNIMTVDLKNPTSEQMTLHYQLQVLINHCVNSAENINSALKFLVLQKNSQSEEDEKKLEKTDFMGLRGIFSKDIKKYSRVKEIQGFENPNEVNIFTRRFYQYIIDRNIYTHGQLGYHVQKDAFCIQFLDGEAEGYAEIDISMLESFLDVSKEIKYFLDRVSAMYSEDMQKGQG